MTGLPLLDLPADPYEAGLHHGRAAAEAIAHNVRVYYHRFQYDAELTLSQVRERAARYLEVIARDFPSYGDAMRGVGDATGIDLIDVAALNARYEILYSQYSAIGKAPGQAVPAGGCTAFAVLPEASADGHLWLGQNWDWIPDVRGLLLRVPGADGLRVAAFTEAGIVGGKIGLNSRGLGLVINGLLSNHDDWVRLGTPFHVRTWRVLHSPSLGAAIDAVTDGTRACSANFLIARANGSGEVVDIEAAPGGTCRLLPRAGVLSHANHFEDPERLGIWQPLLEERTSTYERGGRIARLLADARAAGTLHRDGLMAILRDHDARPDSICRHPNLGLPEVWRVQTVVSVLMDLTERRMYVAPGPPCEASFQSLDLSPR